MLFLLVVVVQLPLLVLSLVLLVLVLVLDSAPLLRHTTNRDLASEIFNYLRFDDTFLALGHQTHRHDSC